MIFGEDFGQLAASGEYEEYKSGTTLASLNAAIAALSDEEYLDSFLIINTDKSNLSGIHTPFRDVNSKQYIFNVLSSSDNTIYCQYWYNNDVGYRVKSVVSGSMTVTTSTISGNTLTLVNWTLYRRQKSYDVATSGSKAAQAIAPVQDTLAAANRNYAVGAQFYYDGHLYKVTSAITSGAQIVIGTNAVLADDVVTQMKDIKSGNTNISIPTTHKASASVTFSKPFDVIPNVVVCANKNSYGNDCFVTVGSITKNGFIIYAQDDQNTSVYTLNVCWIATV